MRLNLPLNTSKFFINRFIYDAKKKLAEIEKEIRTSSFENPKIKDVKEVNDRKYEVTFSMDFFRYS